MICANKECSKEFSAKTHNQKYCCDECCRIATNRRIMEKYYEKKAIRNGTVVRLCKKCKCELSRWNHDLFCGSCTKKIDIDKRKKLMRMIDEVS